MMWAIDPAYQRQGYATEVAKALIGFMFNNEQLSIWRIIADTEHHNLASQGVMRKLGMQIDRNTLAQPDWLQAVGVLENS